MSDWIDVDRPENIASGSHKIVDVDDVAVAVFNIDGSFHAIEDICTHDGAELACGELEGCEIICPRHGARFDLKTGEALTPPAYEAVPVLPTRIHDGMVQVRDDRWD